MHPFPLESCDRDGYQFNFEDIFTVFMDFNIVEVFSIESGCLCVTCDSDSSCMVPFLTFSTMLIHKDVCLMCKFLSYKSVFYFYYIESELDSGVCGRVTYT